MQTIVSKWSRDRSHVCNRNREVVSVGKTRERFISTRESRGETESELEEMTIKVSSSWSSWPRPRRVLCHLPFLSSSSSSPWRLSSLPEMGFHGRKEKEVTRRISLGKAINRKRLDVDSQSLDQKRNQREMSFSLLFSMTMTRETWEEQLLLGKDAGLGTKSIVVSLRHCVSSLRDPVIFCAARLQSSREILVE